MSDAAAGAPGRRGGTRFPALLWALLHVPLFLALFAAPIAAAVAAAPAPYRLLLWPTFLPQAILLALLAFALALPFSVAPRAHRLAAPAAAALVTFVVALDATVYRSVGFHLNGFFFRVLLQPNALRETGVPPSDVALFAGAGALFLAADVAAGAWFIGRRAASASVRRAWPLAAALLALAAAERVYGGLLVYWGGPSIFAASTTLPLQVPVRMAGLAQKVLGPRSADPLARSGASRRLPPALDPASVTLERTPDVLFIVAESLPAAHLDARTMPNLWRRAADGARFTRHYSGASSTNYTLFSLMYALQAQKLEATVGAGRQPVLFPVLARYGYQAKVSAASCVDWMGLKETVFGGVSDLETWCESLEPARRDAAMLASARAFTRAADPARPVFLFLFFFGTHFNYFHGGDADRVYLPEWDGAGGLKATSAPPELIRNRARNAAHALDGELDGFLAEFERARGRAPLVVFTGDHGEEFREKGHIGHGSAVTQEQIHVPAVWLGPGVPRGVFDEPTSHSDVVPTLLALLGDAHPPERWSDGLSMFAAPPDRFVVSTVGWEPRYAAIGKELKVTVYAGVGAGEITDPDDRPLPDGPARMARSAGRILKALRGETGSEASAPATPAAAPGR